VFCFCCWLFPSSSAEPVFTQYGFNNWKDIGEFAKNHASSFCHAETAARLQAARSGRAEKICYQLDRQSKHVICQNRAAIGSLARTAVTCARQDIALRGHDEHGINTDSLNRGNFLELLHLVKYESNSARMNLERLQKGATYWSKASQNDLLQAAADVVASKIVYEVKAAGMYSIIADEARDISKTEQMSICLRYVVGYEIREHFLTFVSMNGSLSASMLANEIANCLKSYGIELSLCTGQCYDGASVMSGEFNGVQQQFRALCGSPCIYVHCYVHRVNLVLVDACAAVKPAGDLFGLLEAVHNFVTASTIRHDKLVSVQRERGEIVMELPLQCDTRWVCKLKVVTTFKERFFSVVLTLQFFL